MLLGARGGCLRDHFLLSSDGRASVVIRCCMAVVVGEEGSVVKVVVEVVVVGALGEAVVEARTR